jgi:tRNA/rRNA methyltransferase
MVGIQARPARTIAVLLSGEDMDEVKIVLVSPRNPLNIGAAARAMSNFGFFHLRVVNAYDVAYAEARSAVNAAEVLSRSEQFPSVAAAVADCTLVVGTTSLGARVLKHPLRRLETAGRLVREHAGRVAILFGSEKFGLSNDDLSHCHWLLRIPTRGEHHSMNLGQAVAVCCYELIRREDEEQRQPAASRPASSGDVERVAARAIECLRHAGYVQELTAESTETKIRRLFHRASIAEADVTVWLGVFRQILWKLHNP